MVRRVENKDNSPQSVQVYMTMTEKVSIEICLLADCLQIWVRISWLPACKSLRCRSPAKQAWRRCYSPRPYQGCSREHGCGHPVQLGLAQEGGCTNQVVRMRSKPKTIAATWHRRDRSLWATNWGRAEQSEVCFLGPGHDCWQGWCVLRRG